MSRHPFSTLFLMSALLAPGMVFATSTAAAEQAPAPDRAAVAETRMVLRDLWVEHVFWIRSYVLATHAHDVTQSKIAEAEIIANAKALSGALTPFYGQAAADGLLELLAGHWDAVKGYDSATTETSKAAQDRAVADLTANAHAIAQFLSGANPYLPEDAVFGLLAAHGAHHIAQITDISAGDFSAEARNWHAMRQHMLVISDAIADAIAKQFPERFQEQA